MEKRFLLVALNITCCSCFRKKTSCTGSAAKEKPDKVNPEHNARDAVNASVNEKDHTPDSGMERRNSNVDRNEKGHAELNTSEKLPEISDEGNELVPVVVRPGHIRFDTRENQQNGKNRNRKAHDKLHHPKKKKRAKDKHDKVDPEDNGGDAVIASVNEKDHTPDSGVKRRNSNVDVNGILENENREPTLGGDGVESVTPLNDYGNEQLLSKNSVVEEHAELNTSENLLETSDAENRIVPLVIRPGQIHFEPMGNQLNGITSQKWGKGDRSFTGQNLSDKVQIEKQAEAIDFGRLPLHDLIKEGEVIAFRKLEQSPKGTPKLSKHRVGKLLSFNFDSKDVVLVPFEGYPFSDGENLNEDGDTLKINRSAMVGVRLFDKNLIKQSNGSASNENTRPYKKRKRNNRASKTLRIHN